MNIKKKILVAALAVTILNTNAILPVDSKTNTNISYASSEENVAVEANEKTNEELKADLEVLIKASEEFKKTDNFKKYAEENLKESETKTDYDKLIENAKAFIDNYMIDAASEDEKRKQLVEHIRAIKNAELEINTDIEGLREIFSEVIPNFTNDELKSLENNPNFENYSAASTNYLSVLSKYEAIEDSLVDTKKAPNPDDRSAVRASVDLSAEGIEELIKEASEKKEALNSAYEKLAEGPESKLESSIKLLEEQIKAAKELKDSENYKELKEATKTEFDKELKEAENILAEAKAEDFEASEENIKKVSNAKEALEAKVNIAKSEIEDKNKPLALEEQKELLRKNIIELESLLKAKKDFIEKKLKGKSEAYNTDLTKAKEQIKEGSTVTLDELNESINLIKAHIEEINEQVAELDKLNAEVTRIKGVKATEKYKKASKAKVDAYDLSVNALISYRDDESKFDKKKTAQLLADIKSSEEALDGDYQSALEKAIKYLTDNKSKIKEETYKSLEKVAEELKDSANEKNTIDTINSFVKSIDEAIKENQVSLTVKAASPTVEKKTGTTKVAVPTSTSGTNKTSKSTVRTGIDSILIFVVVLVIAAGLLIFTRKNKKK